jgi:hypothetical protein
MDAKNTRNGSVLIESRLKNIEIFRSKRNTTIEVKMNNNVFHDNVKAPMVNAMVEMASLFWRIINTAAKNGRANGVIFDKIRARPNKKPIKIKMNPLLKKKYSHFRSSFCHH